MFVSIAMNNSLLKKFAFLAIISFAVLVVGNESASAFAVRITDTESGQPQWYVNKYRVTPVREDYYTGTFVGRFVINADQVMSLPLLVDELVEFVAFRTEAAAQANLNVAFTEAPWKLFAVDERIGMLCRINGTDPASKREYGSGPDCRTSILLTPVDPVPATPPQNQPPTNEPPANQPPANEPPAQEPPVGPQFTDVEFWPQETVNPATLVRDATIRIYDDSTRTLVGTFTPGEQGFALVSIERGKRFYFDAIKNGRTFGGRTPFGQPRVYVIDADGLTMRNVYTGSRTAFMRLIGYPQQGLRNGVVRPVIVFPRR